MTAVGILANPASGKDIRRLVAHGSVFDNHEKANIVGRVLLGLEAAGVEHAWIMPDSFGIGVRALDEVRLSSLCARLLDMPCSYTSEDTPHAARLMVEAGAACLVTLGGDGTNRLVARACGEAPIVPISTGTNNVFPRMVEGTLAGLAAGLVARCLIEPEDAVQRLSCLEIACPGAATDVALVDVAVYDERFVAARAVWDPGRILELVLARAEPGSIGLSSIGAHLRPGSDEQGGMYLRMGDGGPRVLAPIGPGLVTSVGVAQWRGLSPGDEVRVSQPRPCTLAFDGEREVALAPGAEACIRLRSDGPRVVDVKRAMASAAQSGVFVT